MSPYLNEAEDSVPDWAIERLMYLIDRYRYARDQDQNILVSATHNGYAVALAEALMNLASVEDIQRVTGKNINEVRREVLGVQAEHESKALKVAEKLEKRGIDPMKIIESL
jgi:phosphopantetheine adenylyltransferase